MLLLLFGAPPKLYYVIGPSAGWADPTAAEVKLGQLSGGGAATASGNETSPTTTQTYTFAAAATGLTSGTSYRVALVWSNTASNSNVAVSAPFSTIGTHTTTGALVADVASIAGTAVHLTLHTTTGALVASAVTVSGTAQHPHVTTGALTAGSASVSGAAVHPHVSSGALGAGAASIAGTANHVSPHTSAGALAADSAGVSGAAVHTSLLGAETATPGYDDTNGWPRPRRYVRHPFDRPIPAPEPATETAADEAAQPLVEPAPPRGRASRALLALARGDAMEKARQSDVAFKQAIFEAAMVAAREQQLQTLEFLAAELEDEEALLLLLA